MKAVSETEIIAAVRENALRLYGDLGAPGLSAE
jgi:hypothetical protein